MSACCDHFARHNLPPTWPAALWLSFSQLEAIRLQYDVENIMALPRFRFRRCRRRRLRPLPLPKYVPY